MFLFFGQVFHPKYWIANASSNSLPLFPEDSSWLGFPAQENPV